MSRVFYVYLYTDPRNNEIIYVGKGTGERFLSHIKYGNKINPHFNNKLNKIKKAGLDPIINIVHETDNELEALEFEEFLIKEIGRSCDGGTLCNISLGGEGNSRLNLPEEFYKELGTELDKVLAEKYNIKSATTVSKIRKSLDIEQYRGQGSKLRVGNRNLYVWTEDTISLLGTMKDLDVAEYLGISKSSVRRKRLQLGVPSHCGKEPYTLKDKYKEWGVERLFIKKITGEVFKGDTKSFSDHSGISLVNCRRIATNPSLCMKGWRVSYE